MSLIPGFTTKAPTGQMPGVVCGPRQCDEIELIAAPIYSTKTLKIFETLLTVTVVGVSGFLLLILLRGTRRFTTPFFRMLTLLVAVIVTHAIVSIAFKLTTLWFGVLLNPKNVVSLVADLLSKYLSIILIFLLALNRFAIIVYPFLDTLLFAQYRYILLCVLCFALSSGVTYVVIDLSRLRREFIPEIGFVDFIDYPVSYEVSCIAFLVVAFISVCLHLVIVVYLRCSHSKPSSISTTKVQKRMFREIVLMTVTNAVGFFAFHLAASTFLP